MASIRIACLIVLATLGLVEGAQPISVSHRIPSYRISTFTAENRLPENNIKALLQSRDGYLWVGTLYGLARFDGYAFKVFDHSNTAEMTHDGINDLAEDARDGSIWIGTGDGLLCYRAHQFERCNKETQIVHASVGVVKAAREGGVWFSTQDGEIKLYRDRHVQTWLLPGEGALRNVCDSDPSETIVQFGDKLFVFDSKMSRLSVVHPQGPVHCFWKDNEGFLWTAGIQGIWQRRSQEWKMIVAPSGDGMSVPEAIFQMRNQDLWVVMLRGSKRSIEVLNHDLLEPISLPGIPPEARFSRLIEDQEGNVWLGSNLGLHRLQPVQFKVYSTADGLESDDVTKLEVAKDGTIWAATVGGLCAIRNGKVINFPPPFSSGYGNLGFFLSQFEKQLWSEDQKALHVLNTEQDLIGSDGFYVPSHSIRYLFTDRNGGSWLATDHGVFWRNSDGKWELKASEEALSNGDVRVIHQDQVGDIWFGTYGGGLNRLKNGKISAYKTKRGEYNNRAWWIHEDKDGIFWVGSQNGLNRFEPPRVEGAPGRFFTFETEHGLRENVINNIQEDDFGNLWLSGLHGVYSVSREALNNVAEGRSSVVQSIPYGQAAGLLDSECNGGDYQPSGGKDSQGHIWFPTGKGIVMINPSELRKNEIAPPVLVTQIVADDLTIYGDGVVRGKTSTGTQGQRLAFSPGKGRVIAVHYTANSFTAPDEVQFKYRLEGNDDDWIWDKQNRRVAIYTNLRPGQYRFQVIGCNNHGFWNQRGDEFFFSIAPYFWQTRGFYFFCAVATIGIAGLVQAYRLRWQRRILSLESQEALANQRTRIARDLHDDLGTALTGLALELDVILRGIPEISSSAKRIGQVATDTRHLAERMREVVWSVNPRCDTLTSLAGFLEEQASQFLNVDGLRVRFDFPEQIPVVAIDAEKRHEIALSVREALTNVLRHANATEVTISLRAESATLVISVADNGRGFVETPKPPHHNGLGNMRARLSRIGGACECSSRVGKGTCVTFRIPLAVGTNERNRES